MKTFFLILGSLIFAIGLFWVGQGLGYINWPASSFMISTTKWVYYGGCVSAAGVVIIWLSRR